jgi:hypothetical protein
MTVGPVQADGGYRVNLDDFPAPKEGFVITHVLVVADLKRSRSSTDRCSAGRYC